MLDEAALIDDLEGLVLLHDDIELLGTLDPVLRETLVDGVAIVGAVGASRHRGISWWQGEHQYRHGRVDDTHHGIHDYGPGAHDVDTVDGLLMALSPWAVRNVRPDAQHYRGFHGYDAEMCAAARHLGSRVIAQPLPVVHHTGPSKTADEAFQVAEYTYLSKWARPRSLPVGAYWGLRAEFHRARFDRA